MDDYLYQPRRMGKDRTAEASSASSEPNGGTLGPESHSFFLVILALVALVSASSVVGQFRSKRPGSAEHTDGSALLERWTGTSAISALFGDQVYRPHLTERRLYLLTCIAAFFILLLLSASFAALLPITYGLQLPTEARPYWAGGSSLALSLLLVVALWITFWALAKLLWSLGGVCARRARSSRSRMGAGADVRSSTLVGIGLAVVFVLILACVLCLKWLFIGSPAAVMLAGRSMDLASGVSPLLPLLLVGAAAILWALSALRRLRLLDGLGSDNYSFLGLKSGSFEGVGELERDVLIAAGGPVSGPFASLGGCRHLAPHRGVGSSVPDP